ncbi:ubiquinol-cytochrome c reductase iron-sulfur subunit [Rhodothermus bifroesti]|uniref:Rieske (2Fe-2S) protein n=1 Tax=Rhodothermus marinus TaxID=29549 RepID=A0A7V2B2B6_RHOMR|nr:Rieske (2Fe-2S) protein [Rhodothermus bifroesti]GBD01855.1 Cytochrome b6-f complex iron-sulfur subunit [bacterium HR18]
MSKPTSRRVFLQTAGSTLPFVSLFLSLSGCDSYSSMEDDNDTPPPPGSGITIEGNTVFLDLTGSEARKVANPGGFLHIDAADMLVVNVEGTIRAFSSICTHQGCEISSFQNNRFVCFCHGSQFGTDGQVLQGPATRALTAYTVERDGNRVRITKS